MGAEQRNDPMPLSLAQLKALAVATTRAVSWGLPAIKRAERKWQQHAERIPDQKVRIDALESLTQKRGNVVGGALFSTLHQHRSNDLLIALAAFQTLVDYLDNLNERHTTEANGLQLHLAVIDAFDPDRPCADYYRHHPWKDDAGYLRMLVEQCRSHCRELPSYERVRPLLIREATRGQHVFTLNHLTDPGQRDLATQQWVEAEFPGESEWHWFELAAAASGQLAILAVLSLAAECDLDDSQIDETFDAYWPRLPLIAVMLDSYVDQLEDEADGSHLYVAHYPSPERLLIRISELSYEAARDILSLSNGHSHAVVMSCMVTYYLSKSSARTSTMKAHTRQLVRNNGSLARALMPILRTWRIAYSQSSA